MATSSPIRLPDTESQTILPTQELSGQALRVEKRTFSQEQLVSYTDEFSLKYDFDIDPLDFIHSFVDKGILHFEAGLVVISLPFFESYLLAVEFKENEKSASQYFDISASDFDLAAFDLYAEIGPAPVIVERVKTKLQQVIEELKNDGTRKHILLTDELRPSMVRKPERLRETQALLRKAVERVRVNLQDEERKQRLLDISEQITRSAAKKTGKATKDRLGGKDWEAQLAPAIQTWVIGTILLGSGAEHLDATTKQTICKLLVTLASITIDEWTRVRATIDFGAIKSEMVRPGAIEKLARNKDGSVGSLEETKKLVSNLADLIELHWLAEPFRRVTHYICEHARLRVLAKSVEKSAVAGEVEGIVHGLWPSDIDSKLGVTALRKAIKKLPTLPLLRVSLVTHLTMRVYWNHWKKDERLRLLDLADNVLKPLQEKISFSKGVLKRKIQRDL